jgi:gas vesicle protein
MRFLLGILIGAAVGVSVGLIVAPQPGSETRRALQQRMKRTTDDLEAESYDEPEDSAVESEEPVSVA